MSPQELPASIDRGEAYVDFLLGWPLTWKVEYHPDERTKPTYHYNGYKQLSKQGKRGNQGEARGKRGNKGNKGEWASVKGYEGSKRGWDALPVVEGLIQLMFSHLEMAGFMAFACGWMPARQR